MSCTRFEERPQLLTHSVLLRLNLCSVTVLHAEVAAIRHAHLVASWVIGKLQSWSKLEAGIGGHDQPQPMRRASIATAPMQEKKALPGQAHNTPPLRDLLVFSNYLCLCYSGKCCCATLVMLGGICIVCPSRCTQYHPAPGIVLTAITTRETAK